MDKWVKIIAFTYPHEAHMANAYLRSEGITTILKDELTTQVINFYSNAIGGVKILVHENDAEQSIKLLKEGGYINPPAESKNKTTEIVKLNTIRDKSCCPFCKSKNISRKKHPNILTVILFFILGAIFPFCKRNYICFDCGKEWKYHK